MLVELGRAPDILVHDLENWPQTPPEEQADPVWAAEQLIDLAAVYGAAACVSWGQAFYREHKHLVDDTATLPGLNHWMLTIRGIQYEYPPGDQFSAEVATEIEPIKNANPELDLRLVLSVIIQSDTTEQEYTAEELLAYMDSLQELGVTYYLYDHGEDMNRPEVVAEVFAAAPL
jgi:hypothetical protein